LTDALITLENPKSPISEAYRALRTNLQFASLTSNIRKVLLTSAGPREGKSFTAANLAVCMAQAGKKVLLLDADLRNPSQHMMFGLGNKEGLSTALLENQDYRDFIQEVAVEGLAVLTAGPIPQNPAEILGSQKMKELLTEVGEQYDMILIDTPPVIAVTDAVILAQEVDGVILVLAVGEVNQSYAQKAKELFDQVGARILGGVLNKVAVKQSEYYHYYAYQGRRNF
jgi:capsular exopolysaccharide synthesis family protein